jgi:hypothetical protein
MAHWLTPLLLLSAAAAADAQGPHRAYSVLLGGNSLDEGQKIAVDAAGQTWVVGTTYSPDFPVTAGAAQVDVQGDIFIARLSPAGELLSATLFGGSGFERAEAIHLDTAGNLYLAGFTFSPDFPVTTLLGQPAQERGFVVKLDPNGELVYSTVFGGGSSTLVTGLAVDAGGHAYVAGSTRSSNFPTAAALFPSLAGKSDMFVAKLSADGSQFIYSTYLGGSNHDGALGIAVDSAGNAHVAGYTESADFPRVQSLPEHGAFGVSEAVVAKLSPDGSRLIYSTLLGGSVGDWAKAIAIDPAGNALVYGETSSTDFPVREALQPAATPGPNGEAPYDAFLTRLSPAGALLGSTYLGGSGGDGATAMTLDAAGYIYLLGYTSSPDFPLRDPLPIDVTPSWYFHVGHVTKLNPQASEILFSTFLDGTEEAQGWAYAIAVDAAGSIYVTGISNDPDFPVVGPSQRSETEVNSDAFAVKIDLGEGRAPDCSAAVATPGTIWPPDSRMVPVAIGGVTDPDDDPVSIAITAVFQDEPLAKKGQPDATGLGASEPRVRASRAGSGDGRVYHLTFTATDPQGASCTGTVTVCVPHDSGKRSTCGDGGQLVDSISGR